MDANQTAAVRLATAYQALHDAIREGNVDSQIVWQDILVAAADILAIPDDRLDLKAHRDEVKRRDHDFMERYRRSA